MQGHRVVHMGYRVFASIAVLAILALYAALFIYNRSHGYFCLRSAWHVIAAAAPGMTLLLLAAAITAERISESDGSGQTSGHGSTYPECRRQTDETHS